MASAKEFAAGRTRAKKPPGVGQPPHREWHSVAHTHRRALAGRPGEVWEVGDRVPALPTLERGRRLGGGCLHAGTGDGGQLTPQHRQHNRSRPCLGSRRKRGTREQAFGRSRGGFTCKVRCLSDARGVPLVFHLTGGEAADCTATRYDKLARSFLDALHLAAIRQCLRSATL